MWRIPTPPALLLISCILCACSSSGGSPDGGEETAPDADGAWVADGEELTDDGGQDSGDDQDGGPDGQADANADEGQGDCIQDSDCHDSNTCTDDLCDPVQGCLHTDAAGPCDDGDPCTVSDRCRAGACSGEIRDQDQDGFPDLTCGGSDCCDSGVEPVPGCDHESAAGIHPGADELCGDEFDNNCDGLTDLDCAGCSPGYQDHDGDGVCLTDCPNSGLDCGSYGHCQDSEGEAGCVCDPGYAGPNCQECAEGYHLEGGQCLPDIPYCRDVCTSAADCSLGTAPWDADNWNCDDGVCLYAGCLSDAECQAGAGMEDYVCRLLSDWIVPMCIMSCLTAVDCSLGQPAYDQDNYECQQGGCLYAGCNSDAECQSQPGWENHLCREWGNTGVYQCQLSCSLPADCNLNQPAWDTDNYSCPEDFCVYTGCNSDTECEQNYPGRNMVCR